MSANSTKVLASDCLLQGVLSMRKRRTLLSMIPVLGLAVLFLAGPSSCGRKGEGGAAGEGGGSSRQDAHRGRRRIGTGAKLPGEGAGFAARRALLQGLRAPHGASRRGGTGGEEGTSPGQDRPAGFRDAHRRHREPDRRGEGPAGGDGDRRPARGPGHPRGGSRGRRGGQAERRAAVPALSGPLRQTPGLEGRLRSLQERVRHGPGPARHFRPEP